jgi:biopolymer transport protein ExbD
MRFVALFLTILLFSCTSKDYELEDQLYDCLLDKAKKEQVPLKQKINEIEANFIKHGILGDGSGESKIDFYKEVQRTGEFPKLPKGMNHDTSLFQVHKWFQDSVCYGDGDSKIVMVQEKMKELLATNGGRFTPKLGAKAFLSVMDASDFDHPFYRTLFIVSVNFVLEKDVAYIRSIPKKLKSRTPPPQQDPRDITTIEANEKNEVQLNGEFVDFSTLESRLIPIIKKFEQNDQQHIRIHVKLETEYYVWGKIHRAIQIAHRSVLEYYSEKELGKEYNVLSEEEKKSLEKKHPCRIIEVKPD